MKIGRLSIFVAILVCSGPSHCQDIIDGVEFEIGEGSDISFLSLINGATVTMTGGEVSHLTALDSTQLSMSAGKISFLNLREQSEFQFDGGVISHVNAAGASTTTFRSGTASFVNAFDDASVEVVGGNIRSVDVLGTLESDGREPGDGSVIHLRGGTVEENARVSASGTLNLHTGFVPSVLVDDGGTFNALGGNFSSLTMLEGSSANIFGTGLATGSMFTALGFTNFTLTGFSADGRPLDVQVLLHGDGGALNLITVPEPAIANSLWWLLWILVMPMRIHGNLNQHIRRRMIRRVCLESGLTRIRNC